MHHWWIKVFIFFKMNLTDPKPLNRSINAHFQYSHTVTQLLSVIRGFLFQHVTVTMIISLAGFNWCLWPIWTFLLPELVTFIKKERMKVNVYCFGHKPSYQHHFWHRNEGDLLTVMHKKVKIFWSFSSPSGYRQIRQWHHAFSPTTASGVLDHWCE